MAIFNFGSINIDHFYRLPRFPAPGETLAAESYATGLGGKGANQSVAAARSGAFVRHLGAVGTDGAAALARMQAAGVDCSAVRRIDGATGHAIIMTEPGGENQILIHPGANRGQDPGAIASALEEAELGDILLLQNETDLQADVARLAMGKGMEVFYSAAPFDAEAVAALLPLVNVLLVNAIEAEQLAATMGLGIYDLPVETVVVTRGSKGAEWIAKGYEPIAIPAFAVQVVDTTGAGDCFTGALVASLDAGALPADAMRHAAAAAALQVTRPGTADAMPDAAEIRAFLDTQDRAADRAAD